MCGIKKKPQKLRPVKSCGKVAAAKAGGGNAGLWKAWENDKTVFPTLPTDLGNR
jgi:tRNA-binding EMAP/Myf-like protein